MSNDNSLRKNTIFLTLGTIINKGMQFFAVLLYSRWLSINEYGSFDLIYTYVSLLIPIITLSTHESVFRLGVNQVDERKKEYISNAVIFDGINYFLIIVVGFAFWGVRNPLLYFSFSFYLFSELLSVYLKGYLRTIKRLDIYSFALVFQTLIMFLFISYFVLYRKLGLVGMVLGYGCGTIVGDIILIFWGKFFRYFSFGNVKFNKLKEMIAYSFPLVPNEVSWWIMNASDRQIINWFFGDGANGIYAITHKVPSLCSVIFNMFAISWQQEIVTKVENNEDPHTNEIFNAFLQMLLSVCALLLASSFAFYYYLYDRKYFDAINYSPILIVSACCMAISQFYGGIQVAYKRTRNTGTSTIVGAVFNVIFHLVLLKCIGLYAAAISTLISNIIVVYIRLSSVKDIFVARIEKKTILCSIFFSYYFLMSYLHTSMLLNFLNGIIVIGFVIIINKDFILRRRRK